MPEETYEDATKWTLAELFGNEEYRSKVELIYGKQGCPQGGPLVDRLVIRVS